MNNRKSQLKIDIIKFGPGSKKKNKRHPPGGFYWGPAWKETPKQWTPRLPKNRIMNA